MKNFVRLLLTGLLALAGLPALAVNYTFPGNLPAGCSRVGMSANYTCSGSGGLGYNDTVTIAAPMPATVTLNGNLSTNNARINAGGSASNLTLIVNGTLTAEYQAVINANVTATSVNGSGSEVVFGGTLTSNGAITLGYRTTVAGNISGTGLTTGSEVALGGNVSVTTGGLSLGSSSTIAGSVTGSSGAIALASQSQISGGVSCSCAVTMADRSRIGGNLSAASVTSNSQAYLQGTVTTTGVVDLAYASTLGGAVTAGGAITLHGNTQTNYCLRASNSSAITLAWDDRANGGVCCGAMGSCTTSCVVNNSGAAMPAVCGGSPSTPAGRFNAFETTTAPGIGTGSVIKTKVSGSTITLAVVAINTSGTAVATTFTGNVKVEVLNTSDNTGALNSSTNCRSSWGVASGTSSTTLTFAAADLGRKNVSFTVPDAFQNARVRVSYPDTGTATVIGCSTDNFAVRPDRFDNILARDATWATAGTTRTLNNTGTGTTLVHKAGRPFTLSADARASSAAGAVTANYTGTPTLQYSACSGAACTSAFGTVAATLTATNGVISTAATYSETGAFNLRLVDSSFANVDAADSSSAERDIDSTPVAIGRFVPDRFDIAAVSVPAFRSANSSSCAVRNVTYYGQPFGYAVLPSATVTARNGLNNVTTLYTAFPTPTQTYAPLAPASPALDLTQANNPAYAGISNGVATLSTQSGDLLRFTRSNTAPQAPVTLATPSTTGDVTVSLAWAVSDDYGSNGTVSASLSFTPVGFDSGAALRYGALKLASAYGSELTSLGVPVELQYWNGTAFVTNALDSCTALPTASLAVSGFRGGLSACDTAPTAANVSFTNGRGVLRLQAPGNGNAGSVDGSVQLGNSITASAVRCAAVGPSTATAVAASLPWLQVRLPGGTTYDQNPSARFSFGQYRSPLIHQRELY